MPIAKLKEVEMYYEKEGKGPSLILIGGLCNDHALWGDFIPFLSSQFTVITFDNRGSGTTNYPEKSFTVQDMAEDILHLMDHLEIKKAFLVGFSLGGAVAQVLATHSDRFHKAILVATTPKFSEVSKMTGRFHFYFRKKYHDTSLLNLGLIPWLFSSKFLENRELVQKIGEKFYGNFDQKAFTGYERQLEALELFDGEKKNSSIEIPILILSGEDDLLVLPKDVQRMHSLIRNSHALLVPDTGHMLPFEQSQLFLEQILAFFN